jgi:hypothetical protein
MMSTPEDLEALREYVKQRMLAAGIDEHEANPVNPNSAAAHIVAEAWRQPFQKETADGEIERCINYPPPPRFEFSLKEYAKANSKLPVFLG